MIPLPTLKFKVFKGRTEAHAHPTLAIKKVDWLPLPRNHIQLSAFLGSLTSQNFFFYSSYSVFNGIVRDVKMSSYDKYQVCNPIDTLVTTTPRGQVMEHGNTRMKRKRKTRLKKKMTIHEIHK